MFSKFLSTDLAARAIPMACWIALSSLCLAAQQSGAQGNTDIILHNGKILTVDSNSSVAEAVAIRGNKIAAVGTDQQVLRQAGPNTVKIDLKGRTVVPGLMDTHINSWVSPGGYRAELPPDNVWDFIIDWKGVTKKEDVLNQMRAFMDQHKPAAGGWLRFQNSPQGQAQVRLILDGMNRYDLDTVTPNNAALLSLGFPDENGVFVNSKAIEILWKNDGDFLKKYGRYWVGRDGQPDGHLESPATTLVLAKYMPRVKAEEMAPGYRKMMEELNGQGLTTISNKMRGNGIEAYKILERRTEQTVRLAYGLGMDQFGVMSDPGEGLKQFQGMIGSGTDVNWVVSLAPSATDGSGTRACTNLKRGGAFSDLDTWWPFGQCLTDNEFRGAAGRAAPVSGNYFREWILALGKYGLRLSDDHVSGDRTAANILEMLEEITKKYGPDVTKGWTFDHCTVMNPQDIPRAVRLGVLFSCSPPGLGEGGGGSTFALV